MPIINVMIRETNSKRSIITADEIEVGPRTIDFSIADVREIKKDKEKPFLVFDVKFTVNYTLKKPKNSNMGEINIIGEVFYIEEPKEVKKVYDAWKKEKEIDSELMRRILNVALKKFQVESIEQSAKVGLPVPFPLPTLSPPPKDKEKSKSSAA